MRTIITGITLTLSLLAYTDLACSMSPPQGGPSAVSGMPTTKAIFQQLSSDKVAPLSSTFQGPPAWPGSSERSLKKIETKLPVADNVNGATAEDVKAGKTFWGLRTDGTWGVQSGTLLLPKIPVSGQMTSYLYGDDGYWRTGASLRPWARFADNGNGTVTDNLSGLVWLKSANCFDPKTWADALEAANTLEGNNSKCSLNDGSVAGQWRLPNIVELESLVDVGRFDLALPVGHPFSDVQSNFYWSSSSYAGDTDFAWFVYMSGGYVSNINKASNGYVWPVRSRQ